MFRYIRDIVDMFLPVIFFTLFLFVVGFVLPIIINHAGQASMVAEIEQLRADIQNNPTSEMLELVKTYNVEIRKAQIRNNVWFICLYVPNYWDEVKIIETSAEKSP